MRRKNLLLLCALASALSLLATGCQNSAQTEEEIVLPKQEEETGDGGEALQTEGEEQAAGGGAIADQVQAPERFNWEGGSEQVSVKADALVVVPEGEGFQSYKVTGRVFNQEDYDRVSQVLLQGEALWERDMEAMGASNGWTAGEIEERIELYRKKKAELEAAGKKPLVPGYEKGETYDDLIAEWEAFKENAPEEVTVREIPAEVTYIGDAQDRAENYLTGWVTVDGENYFVSLDNNFRDDWKYIFFSVYNDEENSNFSFGASEADIQSAGISVEEARQKAMEDAAAMGFTDMAIDGEEYLTSFSFDETSESGETVVDAVGYGFHFTRMLDGIPVTYTHEAGGTLEGKDDVPWVYEDLSLVYTKNGFASFNWRNPYEVEKTSEEYVFLLPFSEIQNVFQEMIVKKYEDFFAESDVKVEFEIDEVRLGYMRVREKGNSEEAQMVPVWDFFGKQTLRYPDMGEPYISEGHYESWLTVNALDGTIIDRGLGY